MSLAMRLPVLVDHCCCHLALQVQAERTAWELAEELGLDVVTILPNFVLVSCLTVGMLAGAA